jgi:nickel-dependent lactate racemase
MAVIAQAVAPDNQFLSDDAVRQTLERGLGGQFAGAKVLVLIPDHTRTIPLPMLFRHAADVLRDAKHLDFMVALGTHPPLSDESILRLVGITAEERATTYKHIGLLNHVWDNPQALSTIGTMTKEQIQRIAGDVWHPSLGGDVAIRINKHIHDYDHIVILGPVFPHEVAGFSGGAKYLFPGISGPEMINVTHWLGALITILEMIGVKNTPVRAMIHAAADCVPTPLTLVGVVVVKDGLAGMFVGDHVSAWNAAADLSSERHIMWVDKPYQRVLSWAPPMYDELWTGAKAMYKLEPAVAEGGDLIVYAPHLDTVSHVHGKYIYEAGYHVRDYYLKQWDRFKHIPLGVLAHGTHLRGSGTYENEVEKARIDVTLSSKISADDCRILSLGYLNPDQVNIEEWKARDDEGILFVPKAGEMLYRLNSQRKP